jgi:hypothetical protein
MKDSLVKAWREEVGAPGPDVSLDEYVAWMDRDEDVPGPALVISDPNLSVEEEEEQVAIELAREQVLEGATGEVKARVKIIKGLLALKEGDKWKRDPLVAHIEDPRWKQDYLAELIEWMKERNPALQAGLSTLMNYMRYQRIFVRGLGLPEEEVFGATEHTRRAIIKMADWEHGGGLPKRLRDKYDVDKLPLPPSFDGDEPEEARVVAGVREVAKQAFGLGRYSPDLFEAYERGSGGEKLTINMKVELDRGGVVTGWTAFVKKVDGNGDPLESYATNLMAKEMPCAVYDWLEARGFHVEMDI